MPIVLFVVLGRASSIESAGRSAGLVIFYLNGSGFDFSLAFTLLQKIEKIYAVIATDKRQKHREKTARDFLISSLLEIQKTVSE